MADTQPAHTPAPRGTNPAEGSKPTPTQEENDRAAMGEHVIDKEHDGSAEVAPTAPDAHGRSPEHAEHQRKAAEAQKPGAGGSYATRTMSPRPTTSEKKD
jgi:hypothetical protein